MKSEKWKAESINFNHESSNIFILVYAKKIIINYQTDRLSYVDVWGVLGRIENEK